MWAMPTCFSCPLLPLLLQLLASNTIIILSDLSAPSARDQSKLGMKKTLFDGHCRRFLLLCSVSLGWISVWQRQWCVNFLQFIWASKFWMQEFSDSRRSLAPPLPRVPQRWQLSNGLPGYSDNWKAWWLAAGIATICESEWFGECCVRGRGGRGLCESQTASRGELLTPHRCQRAPMWPSAEPRLLMRKCVIIPLWGHNKHALLQSWQQY